MADVIRFDNHERDHEGIGHGTPADGYDGWRETMLRRRRPKRAGPWPSGFATIGPQPSRAPAHASPPDPVWIPGFYDDANPDDVVVFLTNMGAVIDRPAEGRLTQCVDS